MIKKVILYLIIIGIICGVIFSFVKFSKNPDLSQILNYKCKNKIIQRTSVLSYYIIKASMLFSLNSFLDFFKQIAKSLNKRVSATKKCPVSSSIPIAE